MHLPNKLAFVFQIRFDQQNSTINHPKNKTIDYLFIDSFSSLSLIIDLNINKHPIKHVKIWHLLLLGASA